MKKIILYVQFIVVMFYLSTGNAQTSSNLASKNYDHFGFIKHTSTAEDNSNDILIYRYPDLLFSIFSKKNTADESIQCVSLTKDKKIFELTLNYFLELSDTENPPLYFKYKNTRVLIHQEVDYYSIGFYVFILDEKGRFYQLGRFSFKPIDREEPTYKKIKLEVSKRGDELTIFSNKDFSITYKLKP